MVLRWAAVCIRLRLPRPRIAGEEGYGVEGAGGLVLVLEVDVDVALAGERGEALGEGGEFGGGVTGGAAEAEAGVGGGGVDFGGGEVVALGDADGGVVLAEDGVDLFAEPRLVAELEGDGWCSGGAEGGCGEEGGEALGVGFEVGRELEEEEAEFAGLADGFECGDELGYVVGAVGEALEVRDALGRLEAEAEVRRRGGEPGFEHGGRGEGAEGVVDFDRGELGGVELEELFGGRFCGVEGGLPGGVGPAGGSGEDVRGRFDCGWGEQRGLGARGKVWAAGAGRSGEVWGG